MTIERNLKMWFLTSVLLTLLLSLVLFACGLSQTMTPTHRPVLLFGANLFSVTYTLCAVPLALRLFRFQWVGRQLSSYYHRWALVRILLLAVALLVNGVGFALSEQTSFFYLALITLVAMVFVYPSRQRCEAESNNEQNG